MENNNTEECCKEKKDNAGIRLYLEKNDASKNARAVDILCETFGYKESQANTAVDFSNNRGECLIYVGNFDSGIVYAQLLADNEINHRVESLK
jgi:hypothetical protein